MKLPAHDALAVALVTAIQGGDTASLERQLKARPALATARIVDDKGVSRTLAHIVADWPGHFPNGAAIVGVLAAAGAELSAPLIHPGKTGAPETPLHAAASSDDVAVLDALLDHGADIEAGGAVFTGGPAMSDAVIFAQWRAARRLLERGADTTIWQAAALGLVERVEALIASVPTPDVRDLTNALWHACRGAQRSTASLLLDHGADVNWIGHDRKTACDVALEGGEPGFIEWLRSVGAKRAVELV